MTLYDLKKIVDFAVTGWEGLEVLHEVLGKSAHRTIDEVVVVVKGIVESLLGVKSGKVTSDDAQKAILKLRNDLLTHDAQADADLNKKFPQ
jgi:hypothetical protein